MTDIAVVVSVAGEEAYFEFAGPSVLSFLRNNRSADLFVFTDDVVQIEKLKGPLTGRLHIINLKQCFKRYQNLVRSLEGAGMSDEEFLPRMQRYGYLHHHAFVSALLPIAEYYFHDEKKYTHILKIDIDSYFAGGDMMALVREDVRKAENHDLFLVERKHKLMSRYGGGAPGVGFTLWKKGSNFIPKYISSFHDTEQVTILKLRREHKVKTKILPRPGYHFVIPYVWKKGITKEMLEEFLPAYFHLAGPHGRENMKNFEEWFNV